MRAPAQVILIAFSASVIGPPVAAACSPQDYMSPEEWQALSPEQQAENTAHIHDVGAASAAPVAPVESVEAPASETAPPTGDAGVGESPAAGAPSAEAVPRAPAHDRPAARGESPQRRVVVRMPTERTRPVSPPPRSSTAPSAGPTRDTGMVAPVATVTAREPAVSAQSARPDAQTRRGQRRSGERRGTADQRRRATSPRVATPDAAAAEPMTVDRLPTEASPAVATRQGGEEASSGPWAAIAAVLAAVAAMVALILGRPGTRARVLAATEPPPPVDAVESELQAIIAGGHPRDAGGLEGGVDSDAQAVRV